MQQGARAANAQGAGEEAVAFFWVWEWDEKETPRDPRVSRALTFCGFSMWCYRVFVLRSFGGGFW